MVGESLSSLWDTEKKKHLERIARDKEVGYIDIRIIDLLEAINRIEALYTTSSCSGRIAIIDSDWPWEKDDTFTVFKSHEKISESDIKTIIEMMPKERYWLMVRGPILHVIAKDLESAKKLLRLARESGFKHSGVMDVTSTGYLVELISSSQITMPLRDKYAIYVDKENLHMLIMLSNEILENSWLRINKLKEKIESW
jgi:tRNA wybutosine-synthesizing protein 3